MHSQHNQHNIMTPEYHSKGSSSSSSTKSFNFFVKDPKVKITTITTTTTTATTKGSSCSPTKQTSCHSTTTTPSTTNDHSSGESKVSHSGIQFQEEEETNLGKNSNKVQTRRVGQHHLSHWFFKKQETSQKRKKKTRRGEENDDDDALTMKTSLTNTQHGTKQEEELITKKVKGISKPHNMKDTHKKMTLASSLNHRSIPSLETPCSQSNSSNYCCFYYEGNQVAIHNRKKKLFSENNDDGCFRNVSSQVERPSSNTDLSILSPYTRPSCIHPVTSVAITQVSSSSLLQTQSPPLPSAFLRLTSNQNVNTPYNNNNRGASDQSDYPPSMTQYHSTASSPSPPLMSDPYKYNNVNHPRGRSASSLLLKQYPEERTIASQKFMHNTDPHPKMMTRETLPPLHILLSEPPKAYPLPSLSRLLNDKPSWH